MSNTAYPIGSVHRSRDIWESLSTEDIGKRQVWPPQFFVGSFWMLAVAIGTRLIGWLLRQLCR
jgi:hypothetical protein